MKTILVINDNSAEAGHAAELALQIAQKINANILLANTCRVNNQIEEAVLVGEAYGDESKGLTSHGLLEHLTEINDKQTGFKSEIKETDISDKDEKQLAELIIKNNIWLMVKGMPDEASAASRINVNAILNRVQCPLLLVPQSWELKNLERMIYIADLRYCRLHIVRYLAEIAKPWSADVSIAHISARGIPDMVENYAQAVFSEEVSNNVNYDQLFFNNIKEKDLNKAVDVMINGMHNDILVLVNHRFHFEEIVGRQVNETMPEHIHIPLLVFPY